MRIILSPQRRDDTLEIEKNGDSLIINGRVFDFSRVMEGDTLPSSAILSDEATWFAGGVDRIDGELVLNLFLPNPWNYSQEQAFPVPLFNVPDGRIALPLPRLITKDEQAARDEVLALVEELKKEQGIEDA